MILSFHNCLVLLVLVPYICWLNLKFLVSKTDKQEAKPAISAGWTCYGFFRQCPRRVQTAYRIYVANSILVPYLTSLHLSWLVPSQKKLTIFTVLGRDLGRVGFRVSKRATWMTIKKDDDMTVLHIPSAKIVHFLLTTKIATGYEWDICQEIIPLTLNRVNRVSLY